MTRNQGFASAGIVVVAVAVILGFWNLGTPAHQRRVGWDENRVANLNFLRSQIETYYAAHKAVPPSLIALPPNALGIVDPETGKMLDYQPSGGAAYRLCANFGTDTTTVQSTNKSPFSRHRIGRNCFALSATP